MNTSEKPEQGRELADPPRAKYERPVVTELGTLEQMTRGGAVRGQRDFFGGSLPN